MLVHGMWMLYLDVVILHITQVLYITQGGGPQLKYDQICGRCKA